MRNPSESEIDWEKGLIPAVIQDCSSKRVLMVGYMNKEAYQQTLKTKKITFFSRSKSRLWTKGESSGNFLNLISIEKDCDNDALCIQADPQGPTCHNGTESCFDRFQLVDLEKIIIERAESGEVESYTKSLLDGNENRLIQKVGEEAIETVIAAKQSNEELTSHTLLESVFGQ